MSETERGVVANVNNVGKLTAYRLPQKPGLAVPNLHRAYVNYMGERVEGWLRKHETEGWWFAPDEKDPNADLFDSIERKLTRG